MMDVTSCFDLYEGIRPVLGLLHDWPARLYGLLVLLSSLVMVGSGVLRP